MKILLGFLFLLVSFSFSEPLVNVKEHVLKNGLKVLMVEDHQSPLTVCRLYYKVGSTYEMIGKTGLSHMLEHMMFKGTQNVGVSDFKKEQAFEKRIDSLFVRSDAARDQGDSLLSRQYKNEAMAIAVEQRKVLVNNELWNLYQKNGGTELNAWTSDYLTAYIVTLPRNKTELFMWLESDRMKNPVMREFYPERDVVMEERRLRYENSPYGRYYESLSSMLFEAHPYRIPTIGYMEDLKHLTRDDAFGHFKKYYAPNNAVLILVGDIDEALVLKQVEDYFGPIPRQEAVTEPKTKDPESVGQKRLVVKKKVGPVVDLFFKTPGITDKAVYPLNVLEGVLSGKSGRLFKTLVRDKKLVTDISAGHYVQNWVSYFLIHADVIQGVSHQVVEDEIWKELEKIKIEMISERELEKVKNNTAASQINLLRSNESVADRLAFYEVGGDWRMLNSYTDEIRAVTREAVMQGAKTYLTEKNSTVGWVVSPEEGGAE